MKTVRKRMIIVVNFVLVLFVIILVRIGYVQIFNGSTFVERAYDLWTRNIPVTGRRGRILDRNGKLIVGNTLAPTISIIPQQIEDRTYAVGKIAAILEVSPDSIAYHFNRNLKVKI